MSITFGAMHASAHTRRPPSRSGLGDELLLLGLSALGVYHLALAVWMAASPHSFFTALGPFGTYNAHYIRDTATFEAALGVGFVLAVFRPSWRVPVLAITTVQFGLHAVNHLVDASSAHPRWTGWFDFVSLLAATALLALMWRGAARREASGWRPRASRSAASNPRPSVSQPPQAERSTT